MTCTGFLTDFLQEQIARFGSDTQTLESSFSTNFESWLGYRLVGYRGRRVDVISGFICPNRTRTL